MNLFFLGFGEGAVRAVVLLGEVIEGSDDGTEFGLLVLNVAAEGVQTAASIADAFGVSSSSRTALSDGNLDFILNTARGLFLVSDAGFEVAALVLLSVDESVETVSSAFNLADDVVEGVVR